MFATSSYFNEIVRSVEKAQNNEVFFEEIFADPTAPEGKNRAVFFIKPELTLKSELINFREILELIHEKMRAFRLNIHNINILSALYLEKYDIIAQHYGVINKISRSAAKNMSQSARENFSRTYGMSTEESNVLGGTEILTKFPSLNAYSLDYLWQNVQNTKLAGGTYCAPVKLDYDAVFLVNGFHPRQLKHFTDAGRSIVVYSVSGDLPWSVARREFIGSTNPAFATTGSLRRELLERKDELGLMEVSQGINGVHLSAGPIEALVELRRYNSDFSDVSKIRDYASYPLGKRLIASFSSETVDRILSNANVEVDGKLVSVFDLTEEKDSDEVLAILKRYF